MSFSSINSKFWIQFLTNLDNSLTLKVVFSDFAIFQTVLFSLVPTLFIKKRVDDVMGALGAIALTVSDESPITV